MLARVVTPFSPAMRVAGTYTACTSCRRTFRSTSVESTKIHPPGFTASSYLSSDGRFITISTSGWSTMGEETGSSPMTTEQLAVPPRISGP